MPLRLVLFDMFYVEEPEPSNDVSLTARLAGRIAQLIGNPSMVRQLGENSRHLAELDCFPGIRYDNLIILFRSFLRVHKGTVPSPNQFW